MDEFKPASSVKVKGTFNKFKSNFYEPVAEAVHPKLDISAAALFRKGYLEKQCHDVVLHAWGKDYPAHRLILLAQSEYFEKKFTLYPDGLSKSDNSMRNFQNFRSDNISSASCHSLAPYPSNIPVFELFFGDDVTKEGFEFVLKYLYCSNDLKLTADSVLNVLSSALFFQVNMLIMECVDFVLKNMSAETFVQCYRWASSLSHGDISEEIWDACMSLICLRLPCEFERWTSVLCQLDAEFLKIVLTSKNLAIETEYDRYELVKSVISIFEEAAKEALKEQCASPSATSSTPNQPLVTQHLPGQGTLNGESSLLSSADAALPISEIPNMMQNSRSSDVDCSKLEEQTFASASASTTKVSSTETSEGSTQRFGSSTSESILEDASCSVKDGHGVNTFRLCSSTGSLNSNQEVSNASYPIILQSSEGCQKLSSSSSESQIAASLLPPDLLPMPPNITSCSSPPRCTPSPLQEAAIATAADDDSEPASTSEANRNTAAALLAQADRIRLLLLSECIEYAYMTLEQMTQIKEEGLVPEQALNQSLWRHTYLSSAITNAQRDSRRLPLSTAGCAALNQSPHPFTFSWHVVVSEVRTSSSWVYSPSRYYGGAQWRLQLGSNKEEPDFFGVYLERQPLNDKQAQSFIADMRPAVAVKYSISVWQSNCRLRRNFGMSVSSITDANTDFKPPDAIAWGLRKMVRKADVASLAEDDMLAFICSVSLLTTTT